MMTKKLLFVTLLLVLAIASVDLVVDVSAVDVSPQPADMLPDMPDMGDMAGKTADMAGKTADATKSAMDETAATSASWADWAKKQFQGVTGSDSKTNDESSSSPTASPPSVGV